MANVSPLTLHRPGTGWLVTPVGLLLGACGLNGWAQSSTEAAPTQLTPVVVTSPSPATTAGVAGFGDVPLSRTPIQASIVTQSQWRDSGAGGLSALTRFDASVSDAYNAQGYWTSFTVRGFAIDNQFNFLRDGLPINAETALPLDNKSKVEFLKGTSGIQAGTSAPGGLVNLVVKRPEGNFTSASLGWQQSGSVTATADISRRFGEQQAFGVRLNVAAEHLDPMIYNDQGRRTLLALAADWRVSTDTLLEAEIESSRQSEPSVPGFSLLGSRLPSASEFDPRINLNNQPWSLPVVLAGTTGSLRLRQRLSSDWSVVAALAAQRLRSDDRLAYTFGCSAENNFDRYCSDGSFDYYDFRSDNERRNNTVLDVRAEGRVATGAWRHELTVGAMQTWFTLRTQPQADDSVPVGIGTVDGLTVVPTLPADLGTIANTDRTERTTQLYLRDHLEVTSQLALWLGLRHTQLHRESVQTDGTQATAYDQAFTTPWVATSYMIVPDLMVYASWGQGVESAVAPNRPQYTNAGQPLAALKSRQSEVGIKQATGTLDWSLDWFDIRRPRYGDVSNGCEASGPPCVTTQLDGQVHSQGIEASARWSAGAVNLMASAMKLYARIDGSADPTVDAQRPTNVPAAEVKVNGSYALPGVPGLSLATGLVYEGQRMVLPDNSVRIGGWTRWDASAQWIQKTGGATLRWIFGIDNVADRRAWRESPYEYQHVYLFPLAPRTVRVSLQTDY